MRLPPRLWKALTHRWTRCGLKVGGALLVLAAATFYPLMEVWGRHRFDSEIAACSAAGLPVTWDRLVGPPPDPADDAFEDPEVQREIAVRGSSALVWLDAKKLPGLVGETARKSVTYAGSGKLRNAAAWADPPRPGLKDAEMAREILGKLEADSERFDRVSGILEGRRVDWMQVACRRNPFQDRPYFQLRVAGFASSRASLRLSTRDHAAAFQDVVRLLEIEKRGAAEWGVKADYLFNLDATTRTVIWEGIARQVWTEPELAEIQRRLEDLDFGHIASAWVRAEIVALIGRTREVSEDPSHLRAKPSWGDLGKNYGSALKSGKVSEIPGINYQAWMKGRPWGCALAEVADEIEILRKEGIEQHPDGRFTKADHDRFLECSRTKRTAPWWTLCNVAGVSSGGEKNRVSAVLGTALERYRLANGKMPHSLEDLVPRFLSSVASGLGDGTRLIYRRSKDGMFRLIHVRSEGTSVVEEPVWVVGEAPIPPFGEKP